MTRWAWTLALLWAGCGDDPPEPEPQNQAPLVESVSVDLDSPTVSDTLTATAVGEADPDGDPVVVRLDWLVNDSAAGDGSTTLALSEFRKGDQVVVQATPNDGTIDGETVSSEAITIANTAPVVDEAELALEEATGDLVVTATGSDLDVDDGLTWTYEWTNNAQVEPYSGERISASVLEIGDAWQVTAVASDGTDEGRLLSNQVRIVNQPPPDPTTVTLNGDRAAAGDGLRCSTLPVIDPDGHTVRYVFEFLESGVATRTVDSSTPQADLPARVTAFGDSWTCRAKAIDSLNAESAWVESNAQVFDCSAGVEETTLTADRSFTLAYTDGTAWVNDYLTAETVGGGARADDLVGLFRFTRPTEGYRAIKSAQLKLYVHSLTGAADIDLLRIEAPWPGMTYPEVDEAVRDVALITGLTSADLPTSSNVRLDLDPADLNTPSAVNLALGLDNLAAGASKVEFASTRTGDAAPELTVERCLLP